MDAPLSIPSAHSLLRLPLVHVIVPFLPFPG